MDAAPVSDDISMDARVRPRVVVLVVVVAVVVVVSGIVPQRYFLFASRSAACGRNSRYRHSRGVARKLRLLYAYVNAFTYRNCRALCRGSNPGTIPPERWVYGETTSGPAERVFTHTRASKLRGRVECGVKRNATWRLLILAMGDV